MVDLHVAPSETTRGKPLPSGRAPWIALALAVSAALSIFFSMVLPYYVNDLDRFASEDLYLAGDPGQMWPYDTAYSVPFVLAWIYALACAPFVAGAVAMWAGFRLWVDRRTMTHLTRAVTLVAAAVSIGTWVWLLTPVSSTILYWVLD